MRFRRALQAAFAVLVAGCPEPEPARVPSGDGAAQGPVARAELQVLPAPPMPVARPDGPSAPEDLRAMWLAAFESREARERLADELGAAAEAFALAARAQGSHGIELEVRAESPALAVARCLGWIRAAEGGIGRGAAPEWLDAERKRLAAEIHAIEASMQEMPGRAREPASRKEAEVDARTRLLLARAASGGVDAALKSRELEVLAAIARLVADARRRVAEDEARGRGAAHPDVKRARAIVAALEARFAQQAALEQRAAEADLQAWAAAKEPDVVARLTVRQAWLARPDGDAQVAAASTEPVTLRLLAVEAARLEAGMAADQLTHGPRHPDMLVAEQAAAERLAMFRAARKDALMDLRVLITQARALVKAGVKVPADALPVEMDLRKEDLRSRRESLVAIAAHVEALRQWHAGLAGTLHVERRCAVRAR